MEYLDVDMVPTRAHGDTFAAAHPGGVTLQVVGVNFELTAEEAHVLGTLLRRCARKARAHRADQLLAASAADAQVVTFR